MILLDTKYMKIYTERFSLYGSNDAFITIGIHSVLRPFMFPNNTNRYSYFGRTDYFILRDLIQINIAYAYCRLRVGA